MIYDKKSILGKKKGDTTTILLFNKTILSSRYGAKMNIKPKKITPKFNIK